MMAYLQDLQKSMAGEFVCLGAQVVLTIIIYRNIKLHWDEFPIKQLSPLCTLIALLSFLVLNLFSVIGRIIEDKYSLYNDNYLGQQIGNSTVCGQCRFFVNGDNDSNIAAKNTLKALAIIYSGLRQLPMILFALKTLRVSICFLEYKTKQLPKKLQLLFGSEKWLLLTACFYSILICAMNSYTILRTENSYSAEANYQFFCPKVGGIGDWVISIVRYFLLAISYSLSIIAYRELDFKMFIFFIFILSNIQVLLRCVFVFSQNNLDYTSYHEFYYHSIFLNFCGTLILYPYTNFNSYVRQPPSTAVLESFDAFLNCSPGITIIECFAIHLDYGTQSHKNEECFKSFIKIRACKMQVSLEPKKMAEVLPQIREILQMRNVAEEIRDAQGLLLKVAAGECSLAEIKRIQKNLMDYCQKQLYDEWKKTQSRAYVEKQFKKNVVIDEKMNSLGINIGY